MLRYASLAFLLSAVFAAGCNTLLESDDGSESSIEEVAVQAVTSTTNKIPAAQATMMSDSNADGVANAFVKAAGSGNTVTYSVSSTAGQTIKITAATGSADAAARFNTFLTPTANWQVDAAVDVKLTTAGKVGARLDVLYYNGSTFVSRVASPLYKLATTPTTPVFSRIFVTPHAIPATATRLKLEVVLVHLAAKTTGQVTFRNIGVTWANTCYSGIGQTCNECGGAWSCYGICEGGTPVPAVFGQACGCGGTFGCTGMCEGGTPMPATFGQACGCGGTVDCNAMCSGGTPMPANFGEACGCRGTFDCTGTCNKPYFLYTGEACGVGGVYDCDGSCLQ